MRTVIVCLTLMLASGGVAAEQAKSPKKITKTSVMKRAPRPAVAQRLPARKKVINSGVKADSRGFPEKGKLQNATEACWHDPGKTWRQAVASHNGHQNRGVKASDKAEGKAY